MNLEPPEPVSPAESTPWARLASLEEICGLGTRLIVLSRSLLPAAQLGRSSSTNAPFRAIATMHPNTHHPFPPVHSSSFLPVRLLVSRSRTWTTEFLRLTTSVIRHKESSVVGYEGLLELVLAVFIDVLLVVGDLSGIQSVISTSRDVFLQCTYDALRDRLPDGIDLRRVTTTTHSDSDVNVGCVNNVSSCSTNQSFEVPLAPFHACSPLPLPSAQSNVSSYVPNLSGPRISTGSYTLNRSICGSTSESGFPLTLMSPFPCLQCATAVAVFFLPKHCTDCTADIFAVDVCVGRARRCRCACKVAW